jgi:Lipopolysaccharide kinase (Kdo/WaaP) family
MRDVVAKGLASEEAWEAALAGAVAGAGRSPSAVVDGPVGTRWRLKRMRRGGLAGPLWHDRYPSADRVLATLDATIKAEKRGVPTAAGVAMLIVRGPGSLARGLMAVEELDGAEDFASCVTRGGLDERTLAAAMGVVRAMHEWGIEHRDLNLGNLLVVPRSEGAPAVYVIDFDRARFADGALPFRLRQAAIRRLERSCAKLTGAPGPFGPGSEELWYRGYAGGDRALAERLARGRAAGRAILAVHRLGWTRRGE